MTIGEAAKAVGGTINRPEIADRLIHGVSTDTRLDTDGKLFVPLAGAGRDGHDFIHEAIKGGAVCVFSARQTDADAIIVKDTGQALKDFAEYYRQLFDVKVIGITGSYGKTSTKDLMAAVLAEKYNVVKTFANHNNEIGLPLTIFDIDDGTDVVVLEMGMDRRGEISRLSKIARPDYAVITIIGVAHIENLGSQEEIFNAKSEIFDYLATDGKIFLNGDDDFLNRYRGRANTTFYGYGADNAYRASDAQDNGLSGLQYTATLRSGEKVDISVPSPGMPMVMNSLVAAALGDEFGLSAAQITAGISKYTPSGMRMSIIDTPGGVKIIADCYNASPASVKAALDVLNRAEGNTIAILGDMLELGEASSDMHYDTGATAARLGTGTIVCVGENSQHTYEGALSIDSDSRIIYFANKDECIAQLPILVKAGDTVLVKASRGKRFEDIVDHLSNH